MAAAAATPFPGSSSLADTGVEILLVTSANADYACLCHIIEHSKWKLHRVVSCQEALAFLQQHPVGVVISEANLPDGCWKDLLAELAGVGCPPNLIISSRLADEQLWAEVLSLGGYDVLMTPFEREEVFRVGSYAWMDWRGRLGKLVSPASQPPAAGVSAQPGIKPPGNAGGLRH